MELRNIVTSLGPAYIKLGQALSIRPDLLSPAAMVELQKLCDKVPSFDDAVAMEVVRQEFGRPWQEVIPPPAGSHHALCCMRTHACARLHAAPAWGVARCMQPHGEACHCTMSLARMPASWRCAHW